MSLEQNGLSDVDWDWGKLIAVLTRSIQLVSIFPPNIAGTEILIRANRHSFPPLCVFYSLVQTPFPPLPSLPSLPSHPYILGLKHCFCVQYVGPARIWLESVHNLYNQSGLMFCHAMKKKILYWYVSSWSDKRE